MPLSPPLPVGLSGIQLDPGGGLARQLYQVLRERILDGRLPGGTRLPASRDLSQLLGISRNTVTRAFDQLYAEGYVEGRIGDGTYVVELANVVRPAPIQAPSPAPSKALQRLQVHHLPLPAGGGAQGLPRRSSSPRPVSLRDLGAALGTLLAQALTSALGLRRPSRGSATAGADRCLPAQQPWPALRPGTDSRDLRRPAGHQPMCSIAYRTRRSGGYRESQLPCGWACFRYGWRTAERHRGGCRGIGYRGFGAGR